MEFEEPSSLLQIPVVKGTYPYLLGDEYTPSYMLINGYFKQDNLPSQVIKMPNVNNMKEPHIILDEKQLKITFLDELPIKKPPQEGKIIFDYSYVYGRFNFFIDISIMVKIGSYISTITEFALPIIEPGHTR